MKNVAAMTIHSHLQWLNMDNFLFEHNFSSLFLQTLPLCHFVGSCQLFQPAVDNIGTEKLQESSYKCRLFPLQASNLLYVWDGYEGVWLYNEGSLHNYNVKDKHFNSVKIWKYSFVLI